MFLFVISSYLLFLFLSMFCFVFVRNKQKNSVITMSTRIHY
ncbi:hypothetical protein HMPREF1881_00140 [Streptococcus agalactiae]|nr:hypothetical protein HMPREF1881_00140 [Streptococcus agalactiae]